jgi:tRNA threonylcarbamoyladenosine biosynthesis protein TsaB
MSSAKGLCYALDKPLITIGTLELMALDIKINVYSGIYVICPMIDARRMEVFTALYDKNMIEITAPHAAIITDNFLMKELESKVIFVGSGKDKFKSICSNENAEFYSQFDLKKSMAYLSNIKFNSSQFDNLALCEPLYVKEHQTLQHKSIS